MKKIAIIGAGGFGQEVLSIWRDQLLADSEPFEFLGFFDDSGVKKNKLGDVVGTVESINDIDFPMGVAIAVGNGAHIKSIYARISNSKLIFPNIIHPTAKFLFRETSEIGLGNILSLDTIVSCNCTIGNFNIFNTRTTLGHDVNLGSFNVLSPNVQISGSVNIGNGNFFGFNSGIIQKKKIGDNNMLGAGSILLRNIGDNNTYFGSPATKMKI